MKAGEWTCVQTLRTGVVGRDTNLKVMFDNSQPDTIILHNTAGTAGLHPMGLWPDGEPELSS